MTTTFYCYSCHKIRQLDDLAFMKDAKGRSRRVCKRCQQHKQEKTRNG